MADDKDIEYDALYGEIISSRSALLIPHTKEVVYLKHPSHVDQAGLRAAYKFGLKEAKASGIPSEDEMIQVAINNGWWTQEKETDIQHKREFITRLRENSSKVILPSQKEQILKSIKTEEAALHELFEDRAGLISYTAETYAVKKLDEYYLLKMVYKDEDLSERYCTESSLDDLDENQTAPISYEVSKCLQRFKTGQVKSLAATPFFQGLVRICQEDSAIDFYGKPVVSLSIFQCDLFTYANFFKKMIKNASEKIPDYVFESSESLISWCEAGQSSAAAHQSWDSTPNSSKGGERSGRMSSLVGATKADYKKLGLNDDNGKKIPQKSILQLAKEAGGSLSLADIVKNTE